LKYEFFFNLAKICWLHFHAPYAPDTYNLRAAARRESEERSENEAESPPIGVRERDVIATEDIY
jgi:hypothetical protein